jgi:hypothetical protein
MANICKSCGGDGPQVIYNYCTACVAKHTRREIPLGGCAGCDILALRQAALEEETDATPPPGA